MKVIPKEPLIFSIVKSWTVHEGIARAKTDIASENRPSEEEGSLNYHSSGVNCEFFRVKIPLQRVRLTTFS